MAESRERSEHFTFGMLVVVVLVATFFAYVAWTALRHSLEESDVLTVQDVFDFTGQSECHDQAARELIREKGELSKKDAGTVSDVCTARAAGDDFLRQLDAATGANG